MKKLKTILSIAGSDSSGGAGIQADIKAAALLGVHCLTAVTAVTAQNSKGVSSIHAVPPNMLEHQLSSIIEEVVPNAVKLGIIGSFQNVAIIRSFLDSMPDETKIIIDPVMSSTAGNKNFFEPGNSVKKDIINFYRDLALKPNVILTPNVKEANLLLATAGITDTEFLSTLLVEKARASAAIVTGGDNKGNVLKDTLAFKNDKDEITSFTFEKNKIECRNLHGTGCTFSSILASCIALNQEEHKEELLILFKKTELLTQRIIKNSCEYNLGKSIYGPLNIFSNYQYS